MRAKYIYENLDFQRGRDPKRTLGIGPTPDNQKAFINWVISKIPEMIGRKEIPKNIISNTNQYINDPYVYQISKYLNDVLPEEWFWNSEAVSEDSMYKVLYWKDLDYDFYLELGRALYRLGYPRDAVNDDDITNSEESPYDLYEKISFKRGEDPKRSLGLGPSPMKEETFIPYLISKLPEILGTDGIPEDIIRSHWTYLNPDYEGPIDDFLYDHIQPYINSSNPSYGKERIEIFVTDIIPYNPYESITTALKKLGFKKGIPLNLHESISFKRGEDPKKTLDIGIRPENGDLFSKYIAYRIPEILDTDEIPEDIIDDPLGSFIHEKYLPPINSYIKEFLDNNDTPYTLSPSNVVDTRDTLGYNIWGLLHYLLRNMGHPTWD